MATKRAPPAVVEEEAVVELLTWDAADGTEEDEGEDELEEELPADEAFDPESLDSEEELAAGGAESLEEVDSDGYTKERPAKLPEPDRARSHPDLPKVKSSSFKRLIR